MQQKELIDFLPEDEWITPHRWYRDAAAYAQQHLGENINAYPVQIFANDVKALLDVGFVDIRHTFDDDSNLLKIEYRKTQA